MSTNKTEKTGGDIACILGGTGFVGQRLAHRLTRLGFTVRIPTRRRERHRELIVNPAIRVIEANVHEPASLASVFEGCSLVVNLVGILNESGSDNQFQRVHVELPQKVCEAMIASGVRRLLHMSALNADAAEQHSRYLQTRGAGEDIAHAAADQGLLVTSFRPSVIFGPGDSFFNRFAGLLKLSPLLFPLACPDSRFAPVYVGDVVEAFCRSLDAATAGERLDLCGPEVFTLRELVEYTRDLSGARCRIIGLGDTLSRLQAHVLGLVPGKPFTIDNYYSLQKHSICLADALSDLGINATPVAAVVPAYLAGKNSRGRYQGMRRSARRD